MKKKLAWWLWLPVVVSVLSGVCACGVFGATGVATSRVTSGGPRSWSIGGAWGSGVVGGGCGGI